MLLCGGYSILFETGSGISLSIDKTYIFKAYFNNTPNSVIINKSFKDTDIFFGPNMK